MQPTPDQRVRVWVQDETRLGLHTTVRHCWSLRGQQPVIPTQLSYQWRWLYGALEIGGAHESVFLDLPEVTQVGTALHLQEIVKTDPSAIHVVIYDGAGFHLKDGAPGVPENVRIVQLPPYCPELNPVEKLWDMLKDDLCNRVFESLDRLDEAMTQFLCRFSASPDNCRSLVGFGYLSQSVNAFYGSNLPVFNCKSNKSHVTVRIQN